MTNPGNKSRHVAFRYNIKVDYAFGVTMQWGESGGGAIERVNINTNPEVSAMSKNCRVIVG